jgi:hypothetical protein
LRALPARRIDALDASGYLRDATLRAALALAVLLTMLVSSGCGRKAMPEPRKSRTLFDGNPDRGEGWAYPGIRCADMGVESPGRQGTRRENIVNIRLTSNEARRDESAARSHKLFLDRP